MNILVLSVYNIIFKQLPERQLFFFKKVSHGSLLQYSDKEIRIFYG